MAAAPEKPSVTGARAIQIAKKVGANTKTANTYQLQPSLEYSFIYHGDTVKEFLRGYVDEILNDSEVNPQKALTEGIKKIKADVLSLQATHFPRHRVVVHGIVGTIGKNQPTMIYGSQCLASPECGDDGVSVSAKNYERYAAVSVFGCYQN